MKFFIFQMLSILFLAAAALYFQDAKIHVHRAIAIGYLCAAVPLGIGHLFTLINVR